LDAPDATLILGALSRGDPRAADQLLPLVYGQLRSMASAYFRRQPANHTLQPTALVHEAFVQLVGRDIDWQSRAHFLAVSAVAMRDILVDHARRRQAAKRGGGRRRVTLCDPVDAAGAPCDALDIDEAMRALAELNPRQARVAELRFFGGMTVIEAAHVLGISKSTVEEEWRFARAWLSARLCDEDSA
jgi:RNA polymerase sigma factor (TIGR02999 family)